MSQSSKVTFLISFLKKAFPVITAVPPSSQPGRLCPTTLVWGRSKRPHLKSKMRAAASPVPPLSKLVLNLLSSSKAASSPTVPDPGGPPSLDIPTTGGLCALVQSTALWQTEHHIFFIIIHSEKCALAKASPLFLWNPTEETKDKWVCLILQHSLEIRSSLPPDARVYHF